MSEAKQMKICSSCGESKELNKENFIWRKTYWEGKCRQCQNEDRRKKSAEKKGIKYNPANYNDSKVSNKINGNNVVNYSTKERKNHLMLNQEETQNLKDLLENYNNIMALINTKLEIATIDKSTRIPKTYNIEKALAHVIEKKAREKNLTVSDLVNALVKKGLEFFM